MFYSLLHFLRSARHKRLILFGAGSAGLAVQHNCPLDPVYFVDNDQTKWDSCLQGINVHPPARLLQEDPDQLVIWVVSVFYPEIRLQLESMGFQEGRHFWNAGPVFADLRRYPVSLLGKILQELDRLQQNKVVYYGSARHLPMLTYFRIPLLAHRPKDAFRPGDRSRAMEEGMFPVLAEDPDTPASADRRREPEDFSPGESFRNLLFYYEQEKKEIESAAAGTRQYHDQLSLLQGECLRKEPAGSISSVRGPEISVIVPNFNYGRFLYRRLLSIARQTVAPAEILFLDNASTDESLQIAERAREEWFGDRIRLCRNEINSGSVFRQWKKGISLARGEYVWIAESDDFCTPYFLETVMEGFRNRDVVLSYCNSYMIDEQERLFNLASHYWMSDGFDPSRWTNDFVAAGREEIARHLSRYNSVPNASAVVWKRAALPSEDLAPLDTYRLCGDWWLYACMLQRGDMAYFRRPENFFRTHPRSCRAENQGSIAREEIGRVRQAIHHRFLQPPDSSHPSSL